MKKVLISGILILVILLGATGCSQSVPSSSSGGEEVVADEYASWPKKAINVIIPTNAGSGADVAGRLVFKYLQKELGQPIIVTNYDSSGGVGIKIAVEEDNDGYNCMFYNTSALMNKTAGIIDFGPEAYNVGPMIFSDYGLSLCVAANSKYETIMDLVEDAKVRPGEIVYGTEVGGFTHIAWLGFERFAGIDAKIVDTGGGSTRNIALLNGSIDCAFQPYGSVQSYLEAGEIRTLGFPYANRNPLMPDIPTMSEQGLDYIWEPNFSAFFFPKGTPEPILKKFDEACKAICENPDFITESEKLGYNMDFRTSDENQIYLQETQELFDSYAELLKTK